MAALKTGDRVRFKSGVMMSASYGDAIGEVLRERAEVKLGAVERIDVEFPGKGPLLGVEVALFERVAVSAGGE